MNLSLRFLLHELVTAMAWELAHHSWQFWLLSTFCIMLFLEVPRYYLSPICCGLIHAFGYPKLDRVKVEALLRRQPLVTVIVAGRNEEEGIEHCIQSLLDQDYANYEVIVVDDASTDATSTIVHRYARSGKIHVLRNDGLCGRGGRPAATNLGLAAARGEFVISVDADCRFDRHLVRSMIAPFSDPRVGAVAGNVHIDQPHRNFLTQLQAFEYALGIDVRKRWTSMLGCTLQASGALGGFRTSILREIGGWDPELAEDTDVSLRTRKAGYQVRFAPEAVVLTDPPMKLKSLIRQRTRWDRGGFRNYFVKHYRLMKLGGTNWWFALELWTEFLVTVVATAIYPFYLIWMLITAPWMLFVMLSFATVANCWLSLTCLWVVCRLAVRVDQPWRLLWAAVLTPFYKGMLRWARFRALVLEIFRVNYEDPFLPRTVWREAPRS